MSNSYELKKLLTSDSTYSTTISQNVPAGTTINIDGKEVVAGNNLVAGQSAVVSGGVAFNTTDTSKRGGSEKIDRFRKNRSKPKKKTSDKKITQFLIVETLKSFNPSFVLNTSVSMIDRNEEKINFYSFIGESSIVNSQVSTPETSSSNIDRNVSRINYIKKIEDNFLFYIKKTTGNETSEIVRNLTDNTLTANNTKDADFINYYFDLQMEEELIISEQASTGNFSGADLSAIGGISSNTLNDDILSTVVGSNYSSSLYIGNTPSNVRIVKYMLLNTCFDEIFLDNILTVDGYTESLPTFNRDYQINSNIKAISKTATSTLHSSSITFDETDDQPYINRSPFTITIPNINHVFNLVGFIPYHPVISNDKLYIFFQEDFITLDGNTEFNHYIAYNNNKYKIKNSDFHEILDPLGYYVSFNTIRGNSNIVELIFVKRPSSYSPSIFDGEFYEVEIVSLFFRLTGVDAVLDSETITTVFLKTPNFTQIKNDINSSISPVILKTEQSIYEDSYLVYYFDIDNDTDLSTLGDNN